MTVERLAARVEELEGRNAHQEAALETLTRTLLAMEKHCAEQAERLQRLEAQVRALQDAGAGGAVHERPPHY